MTRAQPSSEDGLELLAGDQDEILELFDHYDALVAEQASPAERRSLAEEICSMLTVQIRLRQEILYPAAREALSEQDLVDEASQAHAGLEETIAEVEAGDPTQPQYDARIRVLQELFVECMELERGVLFPRLRTSGMDLEALGGDLSERAELLLSAGEDDEPG